MASSAYKVDVINSKGSDGEKSPVKARNGVEWFFFAKAIGILNGIAGKMVIG